MNGKLEYRNVGMLEYRKQSISQCKGLMQIPQRRQGIAALQCSMSGSSGGTQSFASAIDGVLHASQKSTGRLHRCLRGGFAFLIPALLLGSATAGRAEAVKTGQFVFPRLQFTVYDETTDLWNANPTGDVNLRNRLQKLTNINVSQDPKVVHLSDFEELCRYPFVFMTSEGSFKLPEQEERNLREFLERGGFILADDCVYQGQDRFFKCYIELINKLFPGNPMRKIPYDHDIFHCYYDFPEGAPHMQGVPHGAYGLFEPGTGRLMTVVTPGDLHCGWCNGFFTPEKNQKSIEMGINIIIYFLTH